VSKRSWLGRGALGVILACGVFAYLRPVLGEKRAPRSLSPTTGMLAERSLYRLDASFQNDESRPFRLSELRGNFQVLALVFTRCPSVCPTLVRELSALEHGMPSAISDATRFALVSIDPAHDTPAVLHAYRAKLGLSPDRWLLLRGEPNSIRELSALLGFSYSSADDGMPLAHSKLVTVLNRDGVIIHQQESVSADSQKIVDAITRAL
jgi:protein SCO1/2